MSDVNRLDFDRPASKFEKRREKYPDYEPKPPLRDRIPKLPEMERIDPETFTTPDRRAVACVNMRMVGAPFHEIAKELNYANPTAARTAYYSALANMHPQEDVEILRQTEGMRAEALFRQSLAMASATYLIDEETGEKILNTERLRWHDQASKDLALHAAITGAKAPARMEVTATTQELNQMVHLLVQARGGEDIEADIWEIGEIEAIQAEIVEE